MPFCHLRIKALRRPCPDYWITTQTAPEAPRTLGEHIRRRRIDLHILQKDVAAGLRVNIETLKNWERGVGSPSIRQIPAILAFLGYDPEPVPKNLAGQIRYARRRLGMTQKKLGKAIGVGDSMLWHWEAGRAHPDEPTLRKIRSLLSSRRVNGFPL